MPRPRITDGIYWKTQPHEAEQAFIPCAACDREYRLKQPGVIAVGNKLYRRQKRGPAVLLVKYLTSPLIHGRDCYVESVQVHDHYAPGLEGRGAATGAEEKIVFQ